MTKKFLAKYILALNETSTRPFRAEMDSRPRVRPRPVGHIPIFGDSARSRRTTVPCPHVQCTGSPAEAFVRKRCASDVGASAFEGVPSTGSAPHVGP